MSHQFAYSDLLLLFCILISFSPAGSVERVDVPAEDADAGSWGQGRPAVCLGSHADG